MCNVSTHDNSEEIDRDQEKQRMYSVMSKQFVFYQKKKVTSDVCCVIAVVIMWSPAGPL